MSTLYREQDQIERFWLSTWKVEGQCWIWLGCPHPNGYGHACLPYRYAHRFSYFLANGGLPDDGRWVLHKCSNPLCVNPDHLYAGTPKDNCADREARKRGECRFDVVPFWPTEKELSRKRQARLKNAMRLMTKTERIAMNAREAKDKPTESNEEKTRLVLLVEAQRRKPLARVIEELAAKHVRIEARAAELGVSTVTYRKWEKALEAEEAAAVARLTGQGER